MESGSVLSRKLSRVSVLLLGEDHKAGCTDAGLQGEGGTGWTCGGWVQMDKEGGATAIQNRRGLSMALGTRAVQSTGHGVPVPADTDSRSTPCPFPPCLSLEHPFHLSSPFTPQGSILVTPVPQSLPKAFLRVCHPPSLPASSSPVSGAQTQYLSPLHQLIKPSISSV